MAVMSEAERTDCFFVRQDIIVGYTFHAGDLFHVGQLHQLQMSRKHCDYLIVGLLTDQAIASYKRIPVIPYPWRAELYEALECVDKVVPQDSRDPTDNLKNLNPDVLFHGDDWSEIPGREWMEANGKQVIVTPYFHGISTSSIIERCLTYIGMERDPLVDKADLLRFGMIEELTE